MRAMAEHQELIDTIAGFALFADIPGPRLAAIVHLFEETAFAEGEKVLRQGLAGSAFYIILDGEAAIVIDGDERARLGRAAQLFVRLVVPVHDQVWTFDPGLPRIRELAQRSDVGPEAFLGQQAHDRDVREGLRPVNDQGLRYGPPEQLRPIPERRFGIDDERRAEALGELRRGKSLQLQLACRNTGTDREQC